MPYLICFLLTALAVYFAEKNFEKDKKLSVFLSIIAILLPSILAGFRDETVGFDVLVYVNNIFYTASSIDNLPVLIQTVDVEKLYLALNFLVAKLFVDVHWIYFFASLITTTFIYLGLYYHKDKVPMWLGMIVYLLLFYNRSFNLVRQAIALGIVFYAIRYIKERNFIKYLIFVVIAAQFHVTAYFAISLFLIYQVTMGGNKFLVKVILIAGIVLLIGEINFIINFLINGVGILPSKFARYMTESSTVSINIFSLDIVYRLMIVVAFVFLYKYLISYNKMNSFYFLIMVCDILLMQLGNIGGQFAYRISFYFGYMQIYAIPQIACAFNKKSRAIVYLIVISACFAYWYINYVYFGYSDTWPYTSKLLGI